MEATRSRLWFKLANFPKTRICGQAQAHPGRGQWLVDTLELVHFTTLHTNRLGGLYFQCQNLFPDLCCTKSNFVDFFSFYFH